MAAFTTSFPLLFLLAGSFGLPAEDRSGDPLPPGAVQRLGSQRLRHFSVRAIWFEQSGDRLRTRGADGSVRTWDTATGRLLAATTSVVRSDRMGEEPTFGTRTVLTRVGETGYQFWDFNDRPLGTFQARSRLMASAFSPDESTFAAVEGGRDGVGRHRFFLARVANGRVTELDLSLIHISEPTRPY